MNNLVHAPLGEVAKLNPTFKAKVISPDELVDFLPMSAVSAELTTARATEQRQLCEVQKGYTNFADGDVLLAKITPCFENGKIAFAQLNTAYGFGSTEFHVIRADRERLDARYLVHFLRRDEIRVDGARNMTGSAGQRRVPKHYLESLSIPLPPVPEQRRIAAILDQADALRAKRREALAQLDGLTQSIFMEMFGDPDLNPKGWPMGRIRDILESASYGTSEKSGAEGEFAVLRMNNITRNGELDLQDLKYMNLPAKDHERYLVRAGDVLFNRTNSAELVGKTAMVPDSAPKLAYAGYLVRLRVNAENHPIYLTRFLNTAYAKRMLRGMCKSIIGMANINATEIQAMQIAIPPSQLQQTFAARLKAVEALKATHHVALVELDTLFASLQHRAFRGEL